MASIDHNGHWVAAFPPARGSEQVVAGLCLGVVLVCAVLLGLML